LETIMHPHLLADPSLAPDGARKIAFAESRMPALAGLAHELAEQQALAGLRIAACLHVTTETAALCRALAAAGAEIALCASNPLSTKDDVAAALAADGTAHVYAVRGCDAESYVRQLDGAIDLRPQIVVDDGADLTTRLHAERRDALGGVLAGTEVTSAGVQRMRNLERSGTLAYPVLAVNDAETKHLFDNRHGTGQNTLDGILRATNTLIAGSVLVVVGYGWCGRGVAARARGLGARVIVCEVDPIRVLEAVLDGFEVRPIAEAAPDGDVFVTVTGNAGVIRVEHVERMKPGAILCNSGHFDVEIDVAGLRAVAVRSEEVRPNAVEYELPGGARVVVLAEGRLVGQAAAEASPAAVMDLTFATMLLAVAELAAEPTRLEPGVHRVPAAIEDRVARAKIAALGIRHDALDEAQEAYLLSC
jgi:adenosylhomocysteinase